MRFARPAALTAAAAALAAVAATAAPALAAGTPPPAGGRTERVLLILTPRSRAGLHALAAQTGLDRAQRLSRLDSALPSAGQRDTVAGISRALGLAVHAVSPLSVTVTAPAGRVLALFGSARAVDPRGRFGQALPRLPEALRGRVTAAFGGDETRPAARPLASTVPAGGYTGAQLVQAYGGAAGAAAAGLQRQTVATIELSDWSDGAAVNGTTPADLQAYAAAAGTPLAPGQYTSVVDAQDPPPQPATASSGPTGSDEVALDQEALLSVAPHARQRAYFSHNDVLGELQDYLQVGQDASSGDQITALATSWGACEQSSQAAAYAFDDVFSYVLSTGVTIFAASGDDGVLDCTDQKGNYTVTPPAVDFPASSPEVVAVGGTTLPASPSGPDVSGGAPQPAGQTGWSGSGGGQSFLFPRPAWQLRYRGIGAGQNGYGRLVPDISSDADPATGFEMYSGGNWGEAGGTSLAAPTQAALYTDELIARGIPNGLGDIHARLYNAPASDFTDITRGNNSAGGVTGYNAGAGYDLVTGLGTPKWDSLISAIDQDPGPVAAVTASTGSVFSHRMGQAGFTNLGGRAISVPSVVSYHGLTYYVVAGTNHEPYVRTDATGWRALTDYPADCYQPTAWIGASATFFVACTDPANHAVYVGYAPLVDGQLPLIARTSSGTFSSIGGYAASGPALVEYESDLVLEVLTPGGTVWQNVVSSFAPDGRVVADGWARTGFACLNVPALAVYGSDLYFSCEGLNRSLWLARQTGSGWGRAENLGGVLYGSAGISVDPAGRVTAFALGRGGVLYRRAIYPWLGPWVYIGGRAVGGVGATELSG